MSKTTVRFEFIASSWEYTLPGTREEMCAVVRDEYDRCLHKNKSYIVDFISDTTGKIERRIINPNQVISIVVRDKKE